MVMIMIIIILGTKIAACEQVPAGIAEKELVEGLKTLAFLIRHMRDNPDIT